MPKIKPHSSRRAPPLKDTDFDHEIKLVDHSAPVPRAVSPEDEAVRPFPSEFDAPGPSSCPEAVSSTEQVDDDTPGSRSSPAAEAHQGPHRGGLLSPTEPEQAAEGRPLVVDNAGARPGKQMTGPRAAAPESAIDILYENQRGGFLCGMPLFSSRALGNLDPPAWTNFAHKSSPTNIHTAQVPDPSWDWAWPDWRINHQEGMDEDGWEYSFMFAKHFSWHGPRWWNSFVRRRAWIRKRVKKAPGPESQDPHMLGPEYFSVRAPLDRGRDRSRSPSMDTSHRTSKLSVSTDQKVDTDGGEGIRIEDIRDIAELLRVLRASRIDREKIEAVESYLENGEDDLAHLQEEMHEIMSLFVFQASRRVLLSRLAQLHDQAKKALHDDEPSPRMERRAENLAAAVKHADEEVRKLEYWSDVKGMAKEGESEGAVDQRRGWDSTWQGVDRSGPSEPSPKRYP